MSYALPSPHSARAASAGVAATMSAGGSGNDDPGMAAPTVPGAADTANHPATSPSKDPFSAMSVTGSHCA